MKLESLLYSYTALIIVLEPFYSWNLTVGQSWPWTRNTFGEWSTYGPYGLPWYALYHLFTIGNWCSYILILWILNFCFVARTSGRRRLLYGVGGLLVLWFNPPDMITFWLAGWGKRWTGLLALLVKLPLGAGAPVWSEVFQVSFGSAFHANAIRYILLGFLILIPWLSPLVMSNKSQFVRAIFVP